MASKIKADQFETLDGNGNITLNNSVTMAATKTLPAASLTGTVPTASLGSGTASSSVFLRGDGSWQAAGSTSASDLTSGTLPMARLSGTLPALNGSNLTGISSFDPDGAVVFNDSSADVDFRIESNNDASAFFVQGSDGSIGIGTNSPAFTAAQQGGDFVTIYGQGTNGSILELASNKNTDNNTVGIVSFVNTENSNAAAGSRHYIAQIRGKVETDDSNAGDDSGGNLVFQTKGNGGPIDDSLIITSDKRGLSQFTAKAWAKINGTGTIAFHDSHNCSSLSDSGTGRYTVNWTNDIGNANYACVANCPPDNNSGAYGGTNSTAVGSASIDFRTAAGNYHDVNHIAVLAFGDN